MFAMNHITLPFPFNAYYGINEVPRIDGESYRLALGGFIRDKKPRTFLDLFALPQTSQITRHICVEGWSAIGKWSGVRLRSWSASAPT
jgi:DMSO/TMAO reductase YedYZ molybdopterin-dependent catalytic subunit